MGFKSQLFGFIKRNFILKYRNKLQTWPELYTPILILLTLVLFNYVFTNERLSQEQFKAEPFPLNISLPLSSYLYISPNNTQTRTIGSLINNHLKFHYNKYSNNSKLLKDKYASDSANYKRMLAFGIDFSSKNFPFQYTIYSQWNNDLFDGNKVRLFANSDSCRKNSSEIFKLGYAKCAGNKYVFNGLSTLKFYIDYVIKKNFTNSNIELPDHLMIQNMPKKEAIIEQTIFTGVASYYFTLFFINSLITFVTNLVAEKENKTKEINKMMGMYDSTFWFSWIIVYLIPFTVLNIVISVVLKAINFFYSYNLTIVFFVLIELFSLTTISFGMVFTTLFKKSKTAGAACGGLYSLSSILYFAIFIPRQFGVDLPIALQWVLSLFFPISFALAIDQALYTQLKYDDFSFELIVQSVRPNCLSILNCAIMLFVDMVFYFVLTIYLENVIQGEYGTSKSLLFFLSPSYWLDKRDTNLTLSNRNFDSFDSDQGEIEMQEAFFEPVPPEFENRIGFSIQNLVKTFVNEEKEESNALDHLDLNIYFGQITAILGHNGAGKTTLFNILTGLIKPTKGLVLFENYNISSPNDMFKIRKKCGICSQQDVLYDLLSCYEHLELYAMLKGVKRTDLNTKIEGLLAKLELKESKNILAKHLSGGQKRKLSIAIALIGDPKILILDEPTSGMDPQSRRSVWSLLNDLKKDRIIIFTTHFMDEADILADRKAILIKGKLKCVGSSFFLKNKFGVGYHLNCVKKADFNQEPQLDAIVTKHVTNNKKESKNVKNELSYTLPLNSISKFQLLFEELEESSKSLGLEYLSISMTTLEEVFLRLGEISLFEENQLDSLTQNSDASVDILVKEKPLKKKSIFNFIPIGIQALIRLRFKLAFRNKTAFVYRFIVPLINIILAIVIPKLINITLNYDPNNLPTINLNINDYANETFKFTIINETKREIEEQMNSYLKVNTILLSQPFNYVKNLTYLFDYQSFSGLIFKKWTGNVNGNKITLLYNDTALLSLPYVINELTNFYSNIEHLPFINTTFAAFPKIQSDADYVFDRSSFSALIILGIGLVMPTVSFATEIVHDRELKCFNQLRISGCSFLRYFGTNIFCFLLQYATIPLVLLILLFIIPELRIASFNSAGAQIILSLSILIYMPCLVMISMCFSFIFKRKETAIGVLTTLFTLLILIPFMAVSISSLGQNTQVSKVLHLVFTSLDPFYGIVGILFKIFQIYSYDNYKNEALNLPFNNNIPIGYYFEASEFFLPISLLFGFFNLAFYSFLLYFLDSYNQGVNLFLYLFKRKQMKQIKPNEDIIINEDSDVSNERIRVIRSKLDDDSCPLILQEIRKEFGSSKNSKVAVRNLSFGLNNGEIFGLLGPNGAGKSTTISVITTDQILDAGSVVICKETLNLKNRKSFFKNVGFCAQYSSFWDEITLREHLTLYASIKNISEDSISDVCNDYINKLKITEHADKQSKHLSGGTKRKLAFAISMFGLPKISLLDEPSTGMDPSSKRIFWDTIIETHADRCAILTTHSIEEADILCQRIGILIKGELKCLGSSSYLKEKFGMGYYLEVKLAFDRQHDFFMFISQCFRNEAILVESFSNRYLYNIPRDVIKSLALMFELLEKEKSKCVLIEYTFSQCTLEQVFIKFAKQQAF